MSGLNNYQKFILEAAYKNTLNKPNTSPNLSWYEEAGTIKKRVDLASIWIDADSIPLIAPALSNGEEYSVNVNELDIKVLRYHDRIPLFKVNGTRSSFKSDLLIDSIESSFGHGYNIRLYDEFDDEIPFGLNKWIVDSGSGILTFVDGFPQGYSESLYISFYKYIGRKGNDSILTNDGSSGMLDDYVPLHDKSLVTKDYVDANVTDISEIVRKLVPKKPETFENKDLTFVTESRKGQLLTITDEPVDVVYLDNHNIDISVPQFWDEDGKGYFSIYLNNDEIYKIPVEKILNDEYDKNRLIVESITDSYTNDIVADGFYKSIKLIISLNYFSNIGPYINNPDYPIVTIRTRWYSLSDEGYYSNPLTFGIDEKSNKGVISNTHFTSDTFVQKYISGVPALVAGDSFTFNTNVSTLRKFKKDVHGEVSIEGLLNTDITTKPTYPSFYSLIEYSVPLIIPENVYMENMNISVISRNLDNQITQEENKVWDIRVDSVSDESNRVTSPDREKLNFGNEWDSEQQRKDLKNSNELQMLNGKYQWPRGDYTYNGYGLPQNNVQISDGPNYDKISKEGVRYVTFKYELNNANGFYFEFLEPEGIITEPMNMTFSNIESLQCIVDGKRDWLNMNIPFDGVLSPFDFDDKGCLVVNRSDNNKKYCTFGTEVISGNMYIVVGIKYNLDIKFSGISVLMDF